MGGEIFRDPRTATGGEFLQSICMASSLQQLWKLGTYSDPTYTDHTRCRTGSKTTSTNSIISWFPREVSDRRGINLWLIIVGRWSRNTRHSNEKLKWWPDRRYFPRFRREISRQRRRIMLLVAGMLIEGAVPRINCPLSSPGCTLATTWSQIILPGVPETLFPCWPCIAGEMFLSGSAVCARRIRHRYFISHGGRIENFFVHGPAALHLAKLGTTTPYPPRKWRWRRRGTNDSLANRN
jgi:hypothetical protein